MSNFLVTVPIGQPGPAYVEQFKQVPSSSGGPAKWKCRARYTVRPGDDAAQFHPTLIVTPTDKLRVRSEAQVAVALPASASANATVQLYDLNEVANGNPPVYQDNQTTPAANGGPRVLTPGSGNNIYVVNRWQYLEIVGN